MTFPVVGGFDTLSAQHSRTWKSDGRVFNRK
jgi:hypothetical protein